MTAATALQAVIWAYEAKFKSPFTPSPLLYDATGITHKRFAKLVRGEKTPTADEITALAEFFGVPITDLV
ncbi:MAG: helix-turn-helix transcriptional regulator [Spirosoma sp.]|nr:helix-turn-helix transcriptional regulator [Spirosoma sp.]